MNTVWLERMAWPEVEEALAAGKRTAIVTAGSIEQHGPHLALATDALLSEVLAERLALAIGDALVAPVIRPGCSDHHMAFPGTISFPATLLQDIVLTYCRCLAQHGFQRIIAMATHGGNFRAVHAAARLASAELAGRGVQVISLAGDLEGFAEALMAPLREFGIEPQVKVNHADVTETSAVLAVKPEYVRPEKAVAGFTGELDVAAMLDAGAEGGGLRRITPSGVLGDARGASAAIGRRVIDSVVDYLFQSYLAASSDRLAR